MKIATESLIATRTRKIAATLFAAAIVVAAHSSQAEQCSTSTTRGRYVVVCEGYLTPGPNAPLTFAKELAVVRADAAGKFSGTGTLALGGQILEQTVTGTAIISPDCTGKITYHQTINGHPAPDFHDTFFVSKDGNRIDGLSTDPGSIFSCVLRRVETEE